MSTSMRQYLLKELGVEETKNLMNVSKFVRSSTKLEKEEKCNCCVCKKKSKQMYPHDRNAEYIYNHHVMKVEYLAILTDKYHLCFPKNPKANPINLKPNDYKFQNGFTVYSPRVGVCDKHHTMFHELVGDNDLDLIRQIKIDEAENLVEVFEEFCDDVKAHCTIAEKDSDNLKGYKDRYQSIWDETLLKSLTRLSYILKIKELQTGINLSEEEIEELGDDETSLYYRYEMLIDHIDTMLKETLTYDRDRNLTLPDVEVFTEDELIMLEKELLLINFDRENLEEVDLDVESFNDGNDDNSYKITDEMYEEDYEEIYNSIITGKHSISLSDLYDMPEVIVDYDEELTLCDEESLDEYLFMLALKQIEEQQEQDELGDDGNEA